MTEEDIRTKVVSSWLLGHGFHASEFTLEYVFSVKIGRATMTIGGSTRETKNNVANPRADVLVKRHGQNLLVIEVKAPGQSVEDAKDQGISYARLLDQIAPFVVVTDGTTSRIYDSISKVEISGDSIPIDHPHAVNGFRVSVDDLALRCEAIDLFISLSPANLLEFCRQQVVSRMQRLRGECIESGKKYIPSLYIERKDAAKRLRDILAERKARVIVLTGRPQIGKTNFLCNFVIEEVEKGRPCLFFPSMSMKSGLISELADDFGWSGFSTDETSTQLARRLSRVLGKNALELTLVFDGWNETDVKEAIAIDQELERLSNQTTNISTVISFTNTSARRLLQNRGNPTFVAEAARIKSGDLNLIETNSQRVFERSDWNAVYLDNYGPSELTEAYQKYASAFNVTFDNQPTSDPYLLAIAMRHYQGQSLPQELDEKSLIEYWLESRVARAHVPGTDIKSALIEIGSTMLQFGAPLESTELKRRWGIPVTSSIATEFFDCALLARYPGNLCELVDFYFSRDRDFMMAICAAKWHERIQELLQCTATFPSLEKSGQACLDAAIWFFSQRDTQRQLSCNGKLPVFSCTGLQRLYLRGFAASLSRLKQTSNKELFLGYDLDHWFEQFVGLAETENDYDLRVEALRGALQLSDGVDLDSLPTMFLSESNDFERFTRCILEIDYDSNDANQKSGIGVEFLVKLDYELRVTNEEETYVSESVRHVMASSNSPAEHLLASQAYASMSPKPFLRLLQGVSEGTQKTNYLPSVACAVNAIEEEYYGTGMCPSYMDYLKDDLELAEQEFDEIGELLQGLAISIWNETPVRNLRELHSRIGTFLQSGLEKIDTDDRNECPSQMKFGFLSDIDRKN